MAQACMAANGTGSLLFSDDVTADRNIGTNTGMYRVILSAYTHPNATILIRQCLTVQMDKDPKHITKVTKDF